MGPGGFTKTVALKALHPDVSASSEMARRLRDEGRMLGMVSHPAIVNADGLVLLRDRWTIVMEYVEGPTLKELLRSGPLAHTVAFTVAEIIAEALDFAFHSPGPEGGPLRLVHRDIKPSNIKITPLGEVKILDFGLARADFETREADSAQQQFMSVPYMAPERLEGASSAACDVYSLGSVLFEMLTGSPLGRSYGNPERHAAHMDSCRDRCEKMGIAPSVTAEMVKFLSHNPDERPLMSEVERWCHSMRLEAEGPDLREWARTRIPRTFGQTLDLEDTLIGRVLQEAPTNRETGQWSLVDMRRQSTDDTASPRPRSKEAHTPAPEAAPPEERSSLKTIMAAVVGFSLGTALVLILYWLMRDFLL